MKTLRTAAQPTTRAFSDIDDILPGIDEKTVSSIDRFVIVVPCRDIGGTFGFTPWHRLLSLSPRIQLVIVTSCASDEAVAMLHTIGKQYAGRIALIRGRSENTRAEDIRIGMLYALKTGARQVGYVGADLATPMMALGDCAGVLARHPDVDVIVANDNDTPLRRAFMRLVWRLGHWLQPLAGRKLVARFGGDGRHGVRLFRASDSLESCLGRAFQSDSLFDAELLLRLAGQSFRRHSRLCQLRIAQGKTTRNAASIDLVFS